MDKNNCTYCNAMMIQGVYCHENGCPVSRWEYEDELDSIFEEQLHQTELEEEEEICGTLNP